MRINQTPPTAPVFTDKSTNTLLTCVIFCFSSLLYVRTIRNGSRHTSFSSNSYSATCQKMLLSVYEELLLPVPVELGGSRMDSPQREDAKADSVSSNDDERSVGQQLVNDVSSAPVKTVTMHRSAEKSLCPHHCHAQLYEPFSVLCVMLVFKISARSSCLLKNLKGRKEKQYVLLLCCIGL